MYRILGIKNGQEFDFFEDAFNHQQKYHPDKKIIYSNNGIIELVWNPEWERYSFDGDNIMTANEGN